MAKKQSWAEMDKSETPFRELRTAFRFYNETSGKSPHTVKWYEFRLELFQRFLGKNATLKDLTVANVRGFIAELQSRNVRHTPRQQPFRAQQGWSLVVFLYPGLRSDTASLQQLALRRRLHRQQRPQDAQAAQDHAEDHRSPARRPNRTVPRRLRPQRTVRQSQLRHRDNPAGLRAQSFRALRSHPEQCSFRRGLPQSQRQGR